MLRYRFALAALALIGAASAFAQAPPVAPDLLRKNLVAIGGGRRMNIVCLGRGTPTVLFEYGLGSHLLHWQKVAQPVATMTRACFYDRAGYGFSDPSPRPMTAEAVTDDLHALLRSAGIAGPLVLVGHSLGGLYATLYTDRFPSEVAGLVLIDPSFAGQRPPDWSADEDRRVQEEFDRGQAALRACADLARAGKLTEADPQGCFQLEQGRTPQEVAWLMQQFLKPWRYESAISEAQSHFAVGKTTSVDDLEEEQAQRLFGDRPVIVLTAGIDHPDPHVSPQTQQVFDRFWKAGHDRLAARSTRGISIVVPQAAHFIQLDEPQAVIDAIRTVVDDVRRSR
ncbi:MAG TPA: alpha/beta hydrolase [Rhizomicrobium sp.]|nr:alpha/beta hydrolase [Rhizomicrobium sp.]